MKTRICKKCKEPIEGVFIKCCRSEMVTRKMKSQVSDKILEFKNQKLIHLGDLHPECWEAL